MPAVIRRLFALAIGLVPPAAGAQPSAAPIRIMLPDKIAAGAASDIAIEAVGDGGYRLGGAPPRVWLVPGSNDACAAPSRLADATELGGRFLIVLHGDATISAVDPDRNLASSNIAWMTRLPAMPTTWRVDDQAGTVRLALADGRQAEIDASDGRLTPIRARDPTLAGAIALPWAKRRAVLGDGRLALSRLDGAPDWTLALPPLAETQPAISALSNRIYALAADGTSVVSIDLATRRITPRITLPAAADVLLASRDGRWLLAIARASGLVTIIDVARDRPVRALQVHGGITRAAFSPSYLYLRERDRPFVTMVRLASLEDAVEHVVAIPVGRTPSDDAIAPIGDGMAFLHSAERAIYLYTESGMAENHGTMRSPTEMLAPYAVVPVRGGTPVDLGFTERGLRATGAGQFAGRLRVPYGGPWRLVARDATTRRTVCRDFSATGTPRTRSVTRPVLAADPANPRRFTVEGGNGAALPDRIDLLAMIPASNWQKTVAAQRIGARLFELDEAVPDERVLVIPLDPALAGNGPMVMGARP